MGIAGNIDGQRDVALHNGNVDQVVPKAAVDGQRSGSVIGEHAVEIVGGTVPLSFKDILPVGAGHLFVVNLQAVDLREDELDALRAGFRIARKISQRVGGQIKGIAAGLRGSGKHLEAVAVHDLAVLNVPCAVVIHVDGRFLRAFVQADLSCFRSSPESRTDIILIVLPFDDARLSGGYVHDIAVNGLSRLLNCSVNGVVHQPAVGEVELHAHGEIPCRRGPAAQTRSLIHTHAHVHAGDRPRGFPDRADRCVFQSGVNIDRRQTVSVEHDRLAGIQGLCRSHLDKQLVAEQLAAVLSNRECRGEGPGLRRGTHQAGGGRAVKQEGQAGGDIAVGLLHAEKLLAVIICQLEVDICLMTECRGHSLTGIYCLRVVGDQDLELVLPFDIVGGRERQRRFKVSCFTRFGDNL